MASIRPAPTDTSPYEDRRLYPRVPVALPAFLQAAGARHSVQLLDLSAGGAKIQCAVALATGSAVVLDCGSLGCPAVVRWQNNGQVGLKFDKELDVRIVDALGERSSALEALMRTRD